VTTGEKIRQLRRELGFSQRQLAEPEYPRSYLSQIELDRVVPDPQALRLFAQRLGMPARLTALLLRAQRRVSTGEISAGKDDFATIVAQADLFGLMQLRYAALCGQGETAIQVGQYVFAAECFGAAETAAADELARIDALARRVTCLALSGEPGAAVSLGEAALGAGATYDDRMRARLLSALIMPYAQLGAFERVSKVSQEALALTPRLHDPGLLAYLYRAVTHTFVEQHRFAEALSYADKAMRLSEQLGVPGDLGLCRLASGSALKDADRLAEAEDEFREAIKIFETCGAVAHAARAVAALAEVLLLQGNPASAWKMAATLREIDPWTTAYVNRIGGMAAAECGETVEAELRLRRSAELFESQGGRSDLVETCREWARVLVRQGRLAEAAEVYNRGLIVT
jgi:tetratricopeptide (TPR) repeat protein